MGEYQITPAGLLVARETTFHERRVCRFAVLEVTESPATGTLTCQATWLPATSAVSPMRVFRSGRKPARTSSEKAFGCSQAAKCPPLGSRL